MLASSHAVGAAKENVTSATALKPLQKQESRVWRRFKEQPLGLVGAVVLLLLILTAVLAAWIAPYDPNHVNLGQRFLAPDLTHFFGTDAAGRDVLSRTIYGGRISLAIALVAVTISTVIGTVLGVTSAFYGGLVDSFLGRIVDALLAFPTLVIIITVAAVLGPSLLNTMLIIGLFSWPGLYRLVRAQVFSLREQDFVLAAQAIGASSWRLITRHLIPNTLAPVVVSATFGIAGAILTESGLSFLGLGVSPPTASWGSMLNETTTLNSISQTPWLWIPPGLAILVTVLSVNFVGESLLNALGGIQR